MASGHGVRQTELKERNRPLDELGSDGGATGRAVGLRILRCGSACAKLCAMFPKFLHSVDASQRLYQRHHSARRFNRDLPRFRALGEVLSTARLGS